MNGFEVGFESTPNPNSMKFTLGHTFNETPFECLNVKDTENSPLASKIFGFPWALSVYVGTDFITVKKQDWVSWEVLAEPLAGLIEEHLDNGELVVISKSQLGEASSDLSDEISVKMKWIIENEIRPALASDGGDISFVKFENGILAVTLKGACSGCPSASITLKDGIESYMKEIFPQLIQVISVA
jgi:Fe-S cluster biogenesis protein NfuA